MARVWWLYGLFCLLILASLYWDLRGKEGKEHVIGHREAIQGVVFWIGLALLFCGGLYCFGLWEFPLDPSLAGYDPKALAKQCSLEFLSGYLIEKSLSIDNLFIFLVVFDFFAIPEKYRHRVLFYGILGAIVFRALFIALGSMLMQISWVPLIFGVFLAFTGLKVAFGPESHPDPSKNVLIRLLKRFLPISPALHNQRFFVHEGGRWLGTPLLMALLFLEFTDIVFAVDSVPAIFAITKEPFLVFTSNIFAILGLRSLFFLLAGMASKFHYLKYGLGFILCFVGLKMSWLDPHFDGHFPTVWSLGIILTALLLSALFSTFFPRKSPDSD
ncbi:MAG: TerC family protein [Verrucomicrobia bacterium]|nr:MAG: TerC family protein [Verrucomicrobiota bacterium]